MTLALIVCSCVVAYLLMGVIVHGIHQGIDDVNGKVYQEPEPGIFFLWPIVLVFYVLSYLLIVFLPAMKTFGMWFLGVVDLFGVLHDGIGRGFGRHMARMRDKAFYPELKSPEESKSAV